MCNDRSLHCWGVETIANVGRRTNLKSFSIVRIVVVMVCGKLSLLPDNNETNNDYFIKVAAARIAEFSFVIFSILWKKIQISLRLICREKDTLEFVIKFLNEIWIGLTREHFKWIQSLLSQSSSSSITIVDLLIIYLELMFNKSSHIWIFKSHIR